MHAAVSINFAHPGINQPRVASNEAQMFFELIRAVILCYSNARMFRSSSGGA